MEPFSSRTRRADRRVAPLTALLLTCALLAGCSASGSSQSDSPTDGGVVPGQPGIDAGGGAEGEEIGGDRQVVSTASMTLTSSDPIAAADRAVRIVLDVDGHVDSRTDIPTDENQQEAAQLVLRVPSDEIDETLVALKKVGELIRSSLNQTDVTTQVADLDARTSALETSVDRLLAMMAQATTTADLIDLESALSQRQAELDGLVAQRDSLGDRVEFASVEMYITSPGVVAGAVPGDFWGGVTVGFQALLAFVGGFLVLLGVLVPWLIPLALLAGLVWWLVSRRGRAASGPPAPAADAPNGPLPPQPPLSPRPDTVPAGAPADGRADDTVR